MSSILNEQQHEVGHSYTSGSSAAAAGLQSQKIAAERVTSKSAVRPRKILPRQIQIQTRLISHQPQTIPGHEVVAGSSNNEQIIIWPTSYGCMPVLAALTVSPNDLQNPSSPSNLGNVLCDECNFFCSDQKILEKHRKLRHATLSATIFPLTSLTQVEADFFLKRFTAFPYVLNGDERDKMALRLKKDAKTLRRWFAAQREKLHQLHMEGFISARRRNCPICGVFSFNDDFSDASYDAWQAHRYSHTIARPFVRCYQCLVGLRCELSLTMHMQYFHVGNHDDLLRCRNCLANFFDAKILLLHESECFPTEFDTFQLINFPAYNSISFEAEFGTNNSTNLVPLIPPAEDGNTVVADSSGQVGADNFTDVYVKFEEPLDLK